MLGSTSAPTQDPLGQLLAVISDPKTFERRKDELAKAQADMEAKAKELRGIMAEHEQKTKDLAVAQTKHDNTVLVIDTKNNELVSKQAAFESYIGEQKKLIEDNLTKHKAFVHTEEAALADKKTDSDAREKYLVSKEAALEQRSKDLDAVQSGLALRAEKEEAGYKVKYAEMDKDRIAIDTARRKLDADRSEHEAFVSRVKSNIDVLKNSLGT